MKMSGTGKEISPSIYLNLGGMPHKYQTIQVGDLAADPHIHKEIS